MLVCSVSARPRGIEVTADIAEAAEAIDGSTSGFVIFSALVDDPASVADTVDAFLGDIMVEAASASDDITTGLAYNAAIDESVTAADTPDATIAGGAAARQAMVVGLMPAFVNSDGSRDAYVPGVMIN
jgi:hypothetical protein